MKLPENGLLDFTSLIQIIDYNKFSELLPTFPEPIPSFDLEGFKDKNIFQLLSKKDVFLHHPYNSFDPVINFLNIGSSPA